MPSRRYFAHMSGGEEVPPRDTKAQGEAIFQLSADGLELEYKLTVANIENVVSAHIHLAPPGVARPFSVPLFSGPPGQGPFHGVLAEGVVTAADFVRDLLGRPMSDLVDAMNTGGAYVNVHIRPGISGPDGEIRGQIRAAAAAAH